MQVMKWLSKNSNFRGVEIVKITDLSKIKSKKLDQSWRHWIPFIKNCFGTPMKNSSKKNKQFCACTKFCFFWCCIHFEIFLWGPVKHGQPSEKRLNWSIGEICYACMFLVRKSRVDFKWKKISVLLLFSLIIFDYFKTKIKSTKIKVFKIGFDFQYI